MHIENLGDAYSFQVFDQATDTTPFVIDEDGNVGIGRTEPELPLDVVGAIRTDYKVEVVRDGDAALNLMYSFRDATNHSKVQMRAARGSLAVPDFLDQDDIIGELTYDGYVSGSDYGTYGTGATIQARAPADHTATSTPADLEFLTTPAASIVDVLRMVINSDGNVGIGDFGADTIDSALHLQAGEMRFDGGAGNEAGCIRFDDTGDKLEYANDCSTWVTLDSLAGAGAIELDDLTDVITDYTAGVKNMYLGEAAGNASSPGLYNVSLGVDTLANLDGTCGVAEDCDGNTAIGFQAGEGITLGKHNTVVGRDAGAGISTGDENTFIGATAGNLNGDGTANVAIGYRAGRVNTGSSNVYIGHLAGDANTNGSQNTFVGRQAGESVTDGSDNILLGFNVQPPTATTSNHLNIGDTLFGDLSNDYVGIGIAAPTWQLQAHNSGTGAGTESGILITTGDTGGAGNDGLQLSYSNIAGTQFSSLWLHENAFMQVGTNNTERIRIDADGEIGMGDFVSDTIDSALHLASGELRLDGGAGNEAGCFRFNDTADELEYADDCSTWVSFTSLGGGTPGGNDTEVQYNDSGSFGGDAGMTYNDANGHADRSRRDQCRRPHQYCRASG